VKYFQAQDLFMMFAPKVPLKSFISREFYKAAFLPMLLIATMLLGLYFLMNWYLIGKSVDTLTRDRMTNLQEIVNSQRHIINGQLHSVSNLAMVLKSDATRFFTHPEKYPAPDPAPVFGFAENGVYYKLKDNGGSCLFYSIRTAIGEAERKKALETEALDAVFEDIYNSTNNIIAVFLNTFDSMSRYYPYTQDIFELLPADLDLTTTSAYYMGDATHNPDGHPVWIAMRRDGLGQTLSCLVPVYRGQFLEGVAGIDVSVKKFVERLLTLNLPWGAGTFLLDADGGALAVPAEIERIFGNNNGQEAQDTDPAEQNSAFNILESVPSDHRGTFSNLMGRKSGSVEFSMNGHDYLLCQDTVVDTGWKLMVIADKSTVLKPIEELEQRAILVGYGAIGSMCLFCILVFLHLARNTRRMSERLAGTIGGLSAAIRRLGTGVYETPVTASPVAELDVLSESYKAMARDLKSMHENLEQEVLHANKAKNIATRAEAALKEHQTHLEKLVEKRTLELREANRSLRQDIAARKQMEQERQLLMARLQRAEKMEALGTLAGGVAHDLNNILSGIVSYPDLLLLDMPQDSPLRKPVETMQKSGQKAAAIVQDLLTLARRGVPALELTNLNIIISGYLASPEYERLLAHHPGMRVETDLSKNLLHCMGSSVHLSKMIMNLVSNAAEAMPSGGSIHISTHNLRVDPTNAKAYGGLGEGEYAVFRIVDSGLGISPDDMGRIFDPFYTKKEMGRSGTGLGMTVVWGTVQDHQGDIDVKSAAGNGTEIEVRIPATRRKSPEPDGGHSDEQISGNNETVLVVDDVELQGDIAAGMLERLGYKAFYVNSGEAAVAWLEKRPADLVILDMIMAPNIDGLETYKRIIKIHPGQKAIVVSGFSESDAVKEAQNLGAGQYLKKPYTVETLGTAVKEELLR
jgi:signal transduction histidine kinase